MRKTIDDPGHCLWDIWYGPFVVVAVVFLIISAIANATDRYEPDPETELSQEQEQDQVQSQSSVNLVAAQASGGSGGQATNEGIDVDASYKSENTSTNVVLVPNNNTESCLRIWGISFGTSDGAGGIGIPWRSKKCDFEQAADDAFAAGERENGWFWKCQNKNLYKSFRSKDESKESAQTDCLTQMVGEATKTKTITTLTEQLEFSENERRIAAQKHKESTERLTQACNESKDRMLEACVAK